MAATSLKRLIATMIAVVTAATAFGPAAESAKAYVYFTDGTVVRAGGDCRLGVAGADIRAYTSGGAYVWIDVYNAQTRALVHRRQWTLVPPGAEWSFPYSHASLGARGFVGYQYHLTFARLIGSTWEYQAEWAAMEYSIDGWTCYGRVP